MESNELIVGGVPAGGCVDGATSVIVVVTVPVVTVAVLLERLML